MRGTAHPAGVEEHITRERIASEPGRSRVWPSVDEAGGPHREGEEPKPMMHGGGKSDEAVVAMKPANEVERSMEEAVERRAEAKGNASQQSTFRAQNRGDASQALERIRLTAQMHSLPSDTRGGSRMRESRTYGSVRGALSNERPYRDRRKISSQ